MALINPAGLYTGGRVTLNPLPFEQIYLQQQAHKQAKDEALDKYYQDIPKSINPAGVRTQDIPGFMDKVNGAREFYQKNRDAIKNPRLDRGAAQSQYQAMNTDALTYVNTSKQEEAKKLPFVKVLSNPDSRQRVMDSDLQKLAAHDLPLNDPNRKSFDFSTIDFNPKELSPQENEAHQKALAGSFQPSEEVISSVPNPKDLTITNTYQKKWSPDQLKAMVAKDISTVMGDRRFEYNAQNLWDRIKNNPEQFDALNKTYKGITGKDIQHPAELHAAAQIDGLMGQSTRQEIKKDENAIDNRNFAQQKAIQDRQFANNKLMEGMRQANRKELLDMKDAAKGAGADAENVWVDNYLDKLVSDSDKTKTYNYSHGGVRNKEYDIPLDAVMAKALTIGKDVPDGLKVTEDGKFRPIFYLRDKDGKAERVKDGFKTNPTLSVPISKDQLKLALGVKAVTGKQRTAEMMKRSDTKPISTPAVKKPAKDPLGLF